MVTVRKRASKDWNDIRAQCENWILLEARKLEMILTLEDLKLSQGKIAAWRSILMMEDVTDAQE